MRLVLFVAALCLINPTLNNPKASQLKKQTTGTVQTAKAPVPTVAAPQATPVAAPAPTPAPTVPTPEPVVTPTVNLNDHEQLMSLAGIDQKDWAAVDYIVSHESSWNQSATEPTTQAHGLVQALPFSKTGCDWNDAVCTLRWGNQYATARYGGWWGAQAYWQIHRNW